jgi:hypothetical protein
VTAHCASSPSLGGECRVSGPPGQQFLFEQRAARGLRLRRRHPVRQRLIAGNFVIGNQWSRRFFSASSRCNTIFGRSPRTRKILHRRRSVEQLAQLDLIVDQMLGRILQQADIVVDAKARTP